MKWRWLLVGVLAIGVWQYWSDREITQPDGILAEAKPKQVDLEETKTFSKDGYTIRPQAFFDITARVLSRENYWFGREADLSPVDLALGWGRMSDQQVLDAFEISQSNRFYFWRVKEYPIPHAEIVSSSANMHMIPADSRVKSQLADVQKGHVIRIKGFLVNVDAEDGWRWRSSMKRTDSGNGACELIWVQELEIISQVPDSSRKQFS